MEEAWFAKTLVSCSNTIRRDNLKMEAARSSEIVGILPHNYTASSLKMEAARCSETLVCYHTTTRRHNLKMEAEVLRNVGILPHNYKASQPRRPRLDAAVKASNPAIQTLGYALRYEFDNGTGTKQTGPWRRHSQPA
jgi:hypothetical protein